MKIEISPDQNTLTLNRAVYEAKPVIPSHGCHQCVFDYELGPMCPKIPCLGSERQDGNNVIFMRLDEVAEAV